MKWKEVYEKCNNKKYSAILDIKQPAILKSTFGVFLDKYKLFILLGFLLLSIASILINKINIQTFLCILAIVALLTIALIYYNTYKIELKDDNLNLDIMFRKITIKQGDLANVFIDKQVSNILLIIPFNCYYINIIYSDNGTFKGYSFSTIMTKKEDIIRFFKHFKFKTLKQQKVEDKKDNINEKIRKLINIFIIIAIVIIILLYLYQ